MKGIYGSNTCFLNGMTLQIMTLYVMELLYLPTSLTDTKSLKENLFLFHFPDFHQLHPLKVLDLEYQIEYVFEAWFKIFEYTLNTYSSGPYSHLRETSSIPIIYLTSPQSMGLITDGCYGYLDSFDSDSQRLVVMTPMPKPINSAIYITGSNLKVIFHEIRGAHLLITAKNKALKEPNRETTYTQLELIFRTNFKKNSVFLNNIYDFLFREEVFPALSRVNYLLKITLTSKDSCFEGLLDSRIKCLRGSIENHYIDMLERQTKSRDPRFHFQ
jgi:hypothetical protein